MQTHSGKCNPWDPPVVRLRGGGLSSMADGGDAEAMAGAEMNGIDTEDKDQMKVLYKHPRGEEEQEPPADPKGDEDDYYFNSYAHFGIHEEVSYCAARLVPCLHAHSHVHTRMHRVCAHVDGLERNTAGVLMFLRLCSTDAQG